MRLLRDVRYSLLVWNDLPTRCPVLRPSASTMISLCACYKMSGTDAAHRTTRRMPVRNRVPASLWPYALAMRCPVLTCGMCYYQTRASLADHRLWRCTRYAISLRACYAVFGTGMVYGTTRINLHVSFAAARSGTDLAYGAIGLVLT
eukprot:3934691-Rhodomonas_salina.1